MKKLFLLLILFFNFATPVFAQDGAMMENDPNLDMASNEEAMTGFDQQEYEQPQAIVIKSDYYVGKVIEILEDDVIEIGEYRQPYQKVKVEILKGDDKGYTFEHDWQFTETNAEKQKFSVGDKVVVVKVLRDEPEYYIAEPYRLPSVIWIFVFFVILSVIFAGKKGISALLGLAFSILVIVKYILPQIVAGKDPLVVSFIGSVLILFVALYLAHGFNKRTTVALAGTSLALLITVANSAIVSHMAQLFGLGSEEALSLLQGQFKNIDSQGLFLGGVIIGTLGVLDDVTTAQTATVAEIHRANPKLGVK